MDLQEKTELLKDEYFHLQKVVEDFDSKAITIKAWSVTESLTAVAAGLQYDNEVLWVIGSIASLLFWITEGYWKIFQLAYYDRIREIENWFSGGQIQLIFVLQISNSWYKTWKIRKNELIKVMLWPHVALPHVVIILLGMVLSLLKLRLNSF